MDTTEQLLRLIREKALLRGHFVLSSGATSDYYVDIRRVSLSAEGAWLIAEAILDALSHGPQVEMVGGPTIGADPIVGAIAVTSRLRGKPLDAFLVRRQSKAHGTRSRIEGPSVTGRAVAVLDDVGTTGSSLLQAVEAARADGARVVRALTVLDRGEGAAEAIARTGLKLESLLTLREVLP